jgi:hypothetical protein
MSRAQARQAWTASKVTEARAESRALPTSVADLDGNVFGKRKSSENPWIRAASRRLRARFSVGCQ